ncbi:MAG: hypothetical protein LUE31_03075 [Lachnospiraceae bacterium]|nr:hypothetical protein [Lachnospiraceae bacterium]
MREKLNNIELGGEEFPLKCDLAVLEAIQDAGYTMTSFEMAVAGLQPTGEQDKKGKRLYRNVDPSMKVVRMALPLMVNEGIDIENRLECKSRPHITEADLQELSLGNVFQVANVLRREFVRCFESKNPSSTQEEEKSGR